MRLRPINSKVQRTRFQASGRERGPEVNSTGRNKDGPSTNGDVICGPNVNSMGGETRFQDSGKKCGPEVNSTGQTVQLGCNLILRIGLLQVGGHHLYLDASTSHQFQGAKNEVPGQWKKVWA